MRGEPTENSQASATLMQNLGLHMADDKAAGGIDMLNHLLENLLTISSSQLHYVLISPLLDFPSR
ncbi:hypothetical protein J4727_18775 [Providencia rettgeri]|uniref:Uncharacterized protein n=1 Tax=Providencia rettgeri TaxID=587 RepID=A0A939SPL5_PRORE|nr:hypothetical protein [Providencia rettgeri]